MTTSKMNWPDECVVVEHLDNLTHDQWLDLRSTGLGGSDCAAVYGQSAYTSPLTLWAQKSGRIERDIPSNEAMDWGTILEDSVAYKYARDYDVCVVKWPVMLRHKTLPHMLANLDFLVMEKGGQFPSGQVSTWNFIMPPPGAIECLLEIKTTGIVGRGSSHQWEDDGVPTTYWYQGLHYATVTGIKRVRFAALVAGEGLVVRDRFYDEDERNQCKITEAIFWTNVTSGIEPDVDGHTSTLETIGKMYPSSEETQYEADEFLYETYRKYVATKNELSALERAVKELRAHLELAIGPNEAMTFNGQTLFTYKSTKDGEAFDVKAFRENHPEIYDAYLRPKPGYRVMRMKGEQ